MTKTYVQVSYCLSQIHSIVIKSPFLLFENYQSRVSKNYALFIEYVAVLRKSSIIELNFHELMKGKFQLTLGYHVFAGVSSSTKLGS